MTESVSELFEKCGEIENERVNANGVVGVNVAEIVDLVLKKNMNHPKMVV